ncbi:hypothetical protein DMUE_4013 [Dictyocoela muelleri]|nr:hypothetical protein DMUE_4013 [Dictyocoela muelleri]
MSFEEFNLFNEYLSKIRAPPDIDEAILFIENFDNSENYETLFKKMILIFKYICDVGNNEKINFKEDERIKRISTLIIKKFYYFKTIIGNSIHYTLGRSYRALIAKSAVRFLRDKFCDDNEELKLKLEELENILKVVTDEWIISLYIYFITERYMDEWDYCYNEENHEEASKILITRNFPKDHDWWPEFCRDPNSFE